MNKQKVIITGASGFVGKDFMKTIDHDAYEITVLTRNKEKLIGLFDPSVRIVEADLTDLESLKTAFQNQDVLINLAAEVRNTEQLAKTNIDGTKNCIDAIRMSGIKRVIHLSSVGVIGKPYSNIAIKLNENVEPTPQNEYERTKNISEQLFSEASQLGLFELVVLRPTNVFGEYHPFNALLNLMKTVQDSKPLIYVANSVVNYVYVSDVSASLIEALKSRIKPGVYNVGYAIDLKEFYMLIMNSMHKKTRIYKVPSFLTKFADLMGITKLRSISNRLEYSDNHIRAYFSYPFGIEEGINKTVNHYRKEGKLK